MNQLLEKITGMAPLTDQVIATDILMAAKAEVKNYAVAITETATQEVRTTLIHQLEDAINFYEKMADYMIDNELYYPHDMSKQLKLDQKTVETAMTIGD